VRQQYELHKPLYARRDALIAKIPHFWALVFEQAPPEIDNYIMPSDSKIFADCLKNVSVSRFEIDSPKGSPRSFSLSFQFDENIYFENTVIEKKFWYRRAKDGWTGLVSEPVPINWKKGQDVTNGISAAAVDLWEAKKNAPTKDPKTFPEYATLVKKVDMAEADAQMSFFTLFSFVSDHSPFVSAEESASANAAEHDRRERRRKGGKVEPPSEAEDDEDEEFDETLQIHPDGETLATLIAEDLWPRASKYFCKSMHSIFI
jgi:hypothetical protein